MSRIDQNAYVAMQPELLSGENIVWTGQPSRKIIFHSGDRFLIPFSLMWGGFAIFWEASVLGLISGKSHNAWAFGSIWGVPFVLVGQYLIWGRFFYDAWLKSRTYYALTNKRVLGVQQGSAKKVWSCDISALPAIGKESRSDGFGTLQFGVAANMVGSSQGFSGGNSRNRNSWSSVSFGSAPSFVDIEDVDSVYRLISDAQSNS
jgi:hypothetical protein